LFGDFSAGRQKRCVRRGANLGRGDEAATHHGNKKVRPARKLWGGEGALGPVGAGFVGGIPEGGGKRQGSRNSGKPAGKKKKLGPFLSKPKWALLKEC